MAETKAANKEKKAAIISTYGKQFSFINDDGLVTFGHSVKELEQQISEIDNLINRLDEIKTNNLKLRVNISNMRLSLIYAGKEYLASLSVEELEEYINSRKHING